MFAALLHSQGGSLLPFLLLYLCNLWIFNWTKWRLFWIWGICREMDETHDFTRLLGLEVWRFISALSPSAGERLTRVY